MKDSKRRASADLAIPPPSFVICLDDEPRALAGLGKIIGRALPGHDIRLFSTEGELKQFLKKAWPESVRILIVDEVMAPRHGSEVLASLVRRLPHAKRVLVSGRASRRDLGWAINYAKLDGYIEKSDLLNGSSSAIRLLRSLAAEEVPRRPCSAARAVSLLDQLARVPSGDRAFSPMHRDIVASILAYLFYPDLRLFGLECATASGAKRPDVVFDNASTSGFWHDVKQKHGATHVVVEAKNKLRLASRDFYQLEGYLGPARGQIGILVRRGDRPSRISRQSIAAFNHSRSVIITLADGDLRELVPAKATAPQRDDTAQDPATAAIHRQYGELMNAID